MQNARRLRPCCDAQGTWQTLWAEASHLRKAGFSCVMCFHQICPSSSITGSRGRFGFCHMKLSQTWIGFWQLDHAGLWTHVALRLYGGSPAPAAVLKLAWLIKSNSSIIIRLCRVCGLQVFLPLQPLIVFIDCSWNLCGKAKRFV